MSASEVPITTIAREWTRLGLTGFGGPQAHIALLRELVVVRHPWLDAQEFEDANAACQLLPGPASTQLSILCAHRVGGTRGAIVGGLGFVVPSVLMVLALGMLFLRGSPQAWIQGAGLGAGAAVVAVALRAGKDLVGPSRASASANGSTVLRWAIYVGAGAISAALIGEYLVLTLVACGLFETLARRWVARRRGTMNISAFAPLPVFGAVASAGGLGALAWTSFKVGALSFGGGFVIIPLMQQDAVHVYHWMSETEFLNAVAIGQITPGPITATITAVGYAAHGLEGALVAAVVGFLPSFSFVLLGGGRFERLRKNDSASAFLGGAGPAAVGAILGSAVPLALGVEFGWQIAVIVAAGAMLFPLRQGVVMTLLLAAATGAAVAIFGGPV